MSRQIVLHLFDRKLSDIIKLLEDIKACGFTAIQIPPVQLCLSAGKWWDVYQVFGFSIGNRIGTEEELRDLCTKANALGIKIICDVVLTHVAGQKDNHLKPNHEVSTELVANKFFWKDCRGIANWDDRYQVVTWCYDLPCLRLDNYDLENMIIQFLNRLIGLGVRGFRIDSAKSISLPTEGNDFWWRVFGSLDKNEELFNYAEVLFYPQYMLDKYADYVNVLSNCSCSDASKSVLFFMTHDTDFKFEYTAGYNNPTIISKWRDLLSRNKVANVLFYARPKSDTITEEDSNLWMSAEISSINHSYN